jgi:hypothetical protein
MKPVTLRLDYQEPHALFGMRPIEEKVKDVP